MRYCQNCGCALDQDARFCGVCGCKVETENLFSKKPSENETILATVSNGDDDNNVPAPKNKKQPKRKIIQKKPLALFISIGFLVIILVVSSVRLHQRSLLYKSFNAPIETVEGEAITPNKSGSLSGLECEKVIRIFQGRGFTKITTKPVEMTYGFWGKAQHDENDVASVSVGGNTEYERGQTVSSDTPVVIEYYVGLYTAFEMDGFALTPGGSSKLKGDDAEEVISVFKRRGFQNVQTEAIYSRDKKSNRVVKVTVNGDEGYASTQLISPNTPVIIYIYADPDAAVTPPKGQAITPSESSYMKGMDYNTVIKIFQGRGFTNIKTEIIADLIIGFLTSDGEVESVSVGGNTSYTTGQTVPADTPVIIRYHSFLSNKNDQNSNQNNNQNSNQNNNQSEQQDTAATSTLTPAVIIPEYVKRAAVTAMTNYNAVDIFDNGGKIVQSKLHKYSDTSGEPELYFMYVTSWGTWTAQGENAWHVETMELKSYGGYQDDFRFNLNIRFDESNDAYIVSNVYEFCREAGKSSFASVSRARSPPERTETVLNTVSPVKRKSPNVFRTSVSVRAGYASQSSESTVFCGVRFWFSWS